MLTGNLDAQCLTAALEAGVDGYLRKDIASASLMQSLTLVMTDGKVFPSELTAILIGGHKESLVADMMSRKGLPQCGQQILACLLEGHSKKTIANLLNISTPP